MRRDIIRAAIAEGRSVLFEHELLTILASLGRRVPKHAFIDCDGQGRAEAADAFAGEPGVLKVVSPDILHKTDVGGVDVLSLVDEASLADAAEAMMDRLPEDLRGAVRGFVLEEKVDFRPGLGRELLLGMHASPEFGTVMTAGFGGTCVEALDGAIEHSQGTVFAHPTLTDEARLGEKLSRSLFFRWVTGAVRGIDALQSEEAFQADLLDYFAALDTIREAVEAEGVRVAELEINPLVWSDAWVPVDALLRFGPVEATPRAFPTKNLSAALHPQQVVMVGVSPRMNIGRIILKVMLDNGYAPEQVRIIRADVEEIDGVRCVASLEDLVADGAPPADLMVLAVGAAGVPAVLEEVFERHAARSVLLIPGGMGETEAGRGIAERVEGILDRFADDPERPVLIGNNSLGLVSRGARFDSLFIPKKKLPRLDGGVSKVALVSQSGAYMITRLTKLDFLAPAYQVSLGNQIDARFSHILEAIAEDTTISTLALYIEGFQPGDALRLGAQIRRLVDEGRDVIVYKGGRSDLGQAATAGHTASLAGDYRVFEEMMHDVGAFVASTFTEFVEIVRLSSTLQGKRFVGRRLAMMSNAGYETVGMADNHTGPRHQLVPADFSKDTATRIGGVLESSRIASLINVANPLDITPMANDAVHGACMEAILADEGVDVAVFGNVPLTPNIQSLAHGLDPSDVFDAPGGYAERVIKIFKAASKPFVVVIDAGRHYDALTYHLQDAGLPVFRSADRATKIFGRYVERKLR
jgi:acyl-CoA synthetase (NDP forming)